jgi:hypothetical protein
MNLMKRFFRTVLNSAAAAASVSVMGFAQPAQAQSPLDIGVSLTIVADVSGDAQSMTARKAQRIVRDIKDELGDVWKRVDLSLVTFGNGLDTRVDRHRNIDADEVKELIESYDPEASAPNEPLLHALHTTSRKLDARVAGQFVVVLSGGNLRDQGPDDSNLNRPKITWPDNTHLILVKATPEHGRDLRILGDALEPRVKSLRSMGFGAEDRASKRVAEMVADQLRASVRGIILGGSGAIVRAPASGSD